MRNEMAKITADLFISLDGYASGEGVGPFFGYSGPQLNDWIRNAFDEFHAILMGRRTYELLAEVSADESDEISTKLTATPKIVFSHTLREPLLWKNTRVESGELTEAVMRLNNDFVGPVRTIGSLELVRNLLELRLLDRLRVMIFPVFLGVNGREPFHEGYTPTRLELVDSTTLDCGLSLLEYRIVQV